MQCVQENHLEGKVTEEANEDEQTLPFEQNMYVSQFKLYQITVYKFSCISVYKYINNRI